MQEAQRDGQRRHSGSGGNGGSRGKGGNGDGRSAATQHAIVRETVRALHLGQPLVDEGLCVVPLHCGFRAASKYVLLQQALQRGTMTITEASDAGSVPHLHATNKGPWPVLVFDGEELVGAKQNRISNATILVGVGKTVLPVSCVEQGRWSHRTASFAEGSYASHPRLRQEKEQQVRLSLRAEQRQSADAAHRPPDAPPSERAQSTTRGGRVNHVDEPQEVRAMRFRSDQGAVWEEVARTQAQMCVDSPTGALNDTYEAGKDRLEKILQNLKMEETPSESQGGGSFRGGRPVGVAVFVGGEFVCLDLLRPGRRFGLLYPKLLRGYALEAMLRKARAPKGFDPEVETLRLLAGLMETEVAEQPSADLGQDLRLEGGQLAGSGLSWEDELVQLSVFPKVLV